MPVIDDAVTKVLKGAPPPFRGPHVKEARLSEGSSLEKTRHPETGHLERSWPGQADSQGMSCARFSGSWTG